MLNSSRSILRSFILFFFSPLGVEVLSESSQGKRRTASQCERGCCACLIAAGKQYFFSEMELKKTEQLLNYFYFKRKLVCPSSPDTT